MAWSPPRTIGSAPALRNLADGLFGATQMAFHVQDVGADVTAIHHADVATVVERPAQIEVITLKATDDAIAGLAHRRRHAALIIADVLECIGRAIGNAENCDIRLQRIEIERELREQKRGVSVLGWHSQSSGSHVSLSSLFGGRTRGVVSEWHTTLTSARPPTSLSLADGFAAMQAAVARGAMTVLPNAFGRQQTR